MEQAAKSRQDVFIAGSRVGKAEERLHVLLLSLKCCDKANRRRAARQGAWR